MALFSFKTAGPEGLQTRLEDRSKERIFLEHYSWLKQCALNITHGEREHSEDLVHDVFVQFLDKDLDLSSVADVRGYLNGILRNLHLLQMRRATRHPAQSLSLFDYDSSLIGLRVGSSADQLLSADALVRACDFAGYHKESSLSVSILILRYFHGYYPAEICRLVGTGRKLVYRWIERGRAEIKRYMECPGDYPRYGGALRKAPPPVGRPNAFLRCLRDRIFDSCTTACFVLNNDRTEMGTTELAHLVSCRICLDCRNRKTGLTHVADRMADDISDNDNGQPKGGSGGMDELPGNRSDHKASQRALLRRAYERRRERFEHRPKEISLAFDGQLRATLAVNSMSNRLHLSLVNEELPNSVAVLSEQEFQFVILNREELTSLGRVVHRLPLSDERTLEVIVTPETLGPSIQIVYDDPFFSELTADVDDQELERIPGRKSILAFPSGCRECPPATEEPWRSVLLNKLGNLVPAMNILLTSSIVLGAMAALCFVFWLRGARVPLPGQILEHAQSAESAAVSANRPGVIYQKIAIRNGRRTVERTIYRDAQGVRRPRSRHLSQEDEQLKDRLAKAGINWDAPLSASDFAAARQRFGAVRDIVARTGSHLLTLTSTTRATSTVLKETLTVRDTDYHAVDRTVDLRDGGTMEIAELNYDVLPWGAVNQDWFDPLAGKTATDAPGLLSAHAIRASNMLSDLEIEEAEVQARTALNQLHADTGEQIFLGTVSSGIQVKGVVDTNARSEQLISRLSRIPYVGVSILSVEELRSHPNPSAPFGDGQPVQLYSFEAQASPLEQYMREANQPLDGLSSISRRLLDGALNVQQAEVNLSEIEPIFRNAGRLPIEYRSQVTALSRAYLNLAMAGLDANDGTLRSLGFESVNTIGALPDSGNADGGLEAQVRAYQDLCQELITSRAGTSRPAAVIANEIMRAAERIRLRLAQGPTAISTTHE